MLQGLTNLAKKIFGDANERQLKKIRPLVARINELEPGLQTLSDADLAGRTVTFRQRLENGAPLDDLLVEAFATVREAARRELGMRHYDVQMIGGIVLHQGKISEMKTGEGKTLVATLPVYLNALPGLGVHVVTVNDYLASRDADWMGRVYRRLGLSVGKILSNERNDRVKRAAYAADITYGTNNEFGFDYLRDNMKFTLDEYVQRGHNFAIVDEVDSILVDEARTPLIISGPAESDTRLYAVVDAVIPILQVDTDFTLDEKGRNVTLTEPGIQKIERRLNVENLYDDKNMMMLHHVNQSLKAHHLYKRDKDYVVRDGKVVIVDEHTGRLMVGRRWSDGLHQAIEAKERVPVEAESQTYATITFQNYFRMYKKLAGMTGTADTEAAEFAEIYKLDVVVIPTNKAVARLDLDDIVYKTQAEKFRAVLTEIQDRHNRGQPVLVGTTSVEKSEIVARMLRQAGIRHEVLNAKQHDREAHIVAQAGRLGAITISTNMAGRGTDIKLGGNPDEFAKAEADPELDPVGYAAALERFRAQCAEEQSRVIAAGGLHIVGTERHESRRIDNQLRGRSGRQGDPGSSRFFLSLEDELLRIFGTDRMTIWMERMGLKDDEPIEHRWITSAIENAQKKVEGHNFQQRKNLLEYDDVMNYQRKGVYDLRKRALANEGVGELVDEAIEATVIDMLDEHAEEGRNPEKWNIPGLRARLEQLFDIRWSDTDDEVRDHAREELRKRILGEARASLAQRVAALGESEFREVARMLILRYADQLWKDHLLAMDRLRQGVGLRAYGQRNPLLEYKREAYHMFLMMSAMRDEMLLEQVFKTDVGLMQAAANVPGKQTARQLVDGGFATGLADIRRAAEAARSAAAARDAQARAPALQAPRLPAPGNEARVFAVRMGITRNDPCPCGSGNKFKKCCGEGFQLPDPVSAAMASGGPISVDRPEDALLAIAELPAEGIVDGYGDLYETPQDLMAAAEEFSLELHEADAASADDADPLADLYEAPSDVALDDDLGDGAEVASEAGGWVGASLLASVDEDGAGEAASAEDEDFDLSDLGLPDGLEDVLGDLYDSPEGEDEAPPRPSQA